MKFSVVNPTNNESKWDGWCYQRLYEKELQPDRKLLFEALEELNGLGYVWTGMRRGANEDVRENSIVDAIQKSLKEVKSDWLDILQVRLTNSSVFVDMYDFWSSFYVKPVKDGEEQLLKPL